MKPTDEERAAQTARQNELTLQENQTVHAGPARERTVYASLVVMSPPGGDGSVDQYPGPWKLGGFDTGRLWAVHLKTGVIVPWHNIAWLVPA